MTAARPRIDWKGDVLARMCRMHLPGGCRLWVRYLNRRFG